MTTTRRLTTTALLVTIAAVWLTACGTSDAPASRSSTTSDAPTTTPSPVPDQSATSASSAPQEGDTRIQISIEGERFQATLAESAAARDLVAQLPLRLDMTDHGGVEKTGPLPAELSLAGQPSGADPDVGDVGYYAPGNDLVLYYGDQSYYDGIVVLGHLEGDAAERITRMESDVTVVVDRSEQ